jgi:hypothetical protein
LQGRFLPRAGFIVRKITLAPKCIIVRRLYCRADRVLKPVLSGLNVRSSSRHCPDHKEPDPGVRSCPHAEVRASFMFPQAGKQFGSTVARIGIQSRPGGDSPSIV